MRNKSVIRECGVSEGEQTCWSGGNGTYTDVFLSRGPKGRERAWVDMKDLHKRLRKGNSLLSEPSGSDNRAPGGKKIQNVARFFPTVSHPGL